MFEYIKYVISRILNRRPVSVKNSKINKTASVGNGSQIVNSTIGRYSYIYGSKVIHTNIGSFCSIASDCVIGGGKHPTNWVSSSPVFYQGKNVLNRNFSKQKFDEYINTVIENDVWIGSKCLIKSGITIGNGAIIGMGSVVTHDVPPYEIWAGNPAHFIRKRFQDDIIEKLQKTKWWEWSDEDLKEIGDYFDDPIKLLNNLEEEKK
ncbi:CatB-related O-acetyltransferase [Clostridium perfringens]|uniref:CatB-related O-acetyltransferase n=1 Tax=Clostridium perfringens TaxID=1502 RepID=UPI0024BCD85C|nr:CatB-related O-acetyltransferase [Clostridium perfringens]